MRGRCIKTKVQGRLVYCRQRASELAYDSATHEVVMQLDQYSVLLVARIHPQGCGMHLRNSERKVPNSQDRDSITGTSASGQDIYDVLCSSQLVTQ